MLTALTALALSPMLFDSGALFAETKAEAHIATTVSISICGNSKVQGEQLCDNEDLNGKTCQDFGYNYGELRCGLACDEFITDYCYNDLLKLEKGQDIITIKENNSFGNLLSRVVTTNIKISTFLYTSMLMGIWY